MIELQCDPILPTVCIVMRDGDWLGDVEVMADGTWQGDVTGGNGPPSKRFATQMEAVAYVLNPGA